MMPSATDPTSIESARANILASSTAQVARLNATRKSIYLSKFHDWQLNVESGRIDNTNPPQPPVAWELAPPDENGFVFYQESANTPVCDMPPLPGNFTKPIARRGDESKPPVVDIGGPNGFGNFLVGPNDTMPFGAMVTQAGVTYRKGSSLRGMFYEVVS